MSYVLRVNGEPRQVAAGVQTASLLTVLRDQLDLRGAKGGCDDGSCGVCSVRIDGRVVSSCLVLAAAVQGAIETIEGQEVDGALSAVQAAFTREGAVQCGFCTPGLVMAVEALLADTPSPTELQVREGIAGNLCRCTGYGRIVAAVQAAVVERHG